jgi:hypothetical protein
MKLIAKITFALSLLLVLASFSKENPNKATEKLCHLLGTKLGATDFSMDSALLSVPATKRFIDNADKGASIVVVAPSLGWIDRAPVQPLFRVFPQRREVSNFNIKTYYEDVVTHIQTELLPVTIEGVTDPTGSALSYSPKDGEFFGKNIVLKGTNKTNVDEKFEIKTYVPKSFKMVDFNPGLDENGRFKPLLINKSEGLTLQWEPDTYNAQGVAIEVEWHSYDNGELTKPTAESKRVVYTIACKDNGIYHFTPQMLSKFPTGNVIVTMKRFAIDMQNISPLQLPVEIGIVNRTQIFCHMN